MCYGTGNLNWWFSDLAGLDTFLLLSSLKHFNTTVLKGTDALTRNPGCSSCLPVLFVHALWLEPTWGHSPTSHVIMSGKVRRCEKLVKWLEEPGFLATVACACILYAHSMEQDSSCTERKIITLQINFWLYICPYIQCMLNTKTKYNAIHVYIPC